MPRGADRLAERLAKRLVHAIRWSVRVCHRLRVRFSVREWHERGGDGGGGNSQNGGRSCPPGDACLPDGALAASILVPVLAVLLLGAVAAWWRLNRPRGKPKQLNAGSMVAIGHAYMATAVEGAPARGSTVLTAPGSVSEWGSRKG